MKLLILLCACVLVSGCASPNCGTSAYIVAVSPAVATLDHMAAAPANRQRFQETSTSSFAAPGCVSPALSAVLTPMWSVSDPASAQISNLSDGTGGDAVCLKAASAPIVVTATLSAPALAPVRTATLLCK